MRVSARAYVTVAVVFLSCVLAQTDTWAFKCRGGCAPGRPIDVYAIAKAAKFKCGPHPCSPLAPEDFAALDMANQKLRSLMPSADGAVGAGSACGLGPCPRNGRVIDVSEINAASVLKCGNQPCQPGRPQDASAVDAAHRRLWEALSE
jgi:hypothetical protein